MLSNDLQSRPTALIQAKRLGRKLFDLLSPPTCASCHQAGSLFCDNCKADLKWMAPPLCSACGQPLARPADRCWFCHRRLLSLRQVRAAVVFENGIANAVYALKYNGRFGLADVLAAMMIEAWPQWQTSADLVVPVPLHTSRMRERGYNQSELLAERFATAINRPMAAAALIRARSTRPQVGLDMDARRLNVENAFAADGAVVAGKQVLLVDDVCTTGATLTAAADALLEAGAVSVSAYCLARAVNKRHRS